MELTDEQWKFIEAFLPKPEVRDDGRGRPWRDPRDIFNGILWILKTGARWKDLPARFPPYQTCHRRYQEWIKNGTLETALKGGLAEHLLKEGKLDLSECFIDGTFSSAKKGVLRLVKQSAAKGPRSWQSQTAMAYLSRPGLKALAHMKLNSWNPPSKTDSRKRNPKKSSAIRPNYRRIIVRYEYHADNYQGMVHLGCIMILMRYL